MFEAYDGTPFSNDEEREAYEHTKLQRRPIKLSIINVYQYTIQTQMDLQRVISLERDGGYKVVLSDSIKLGDQIVAFTDDEQRELHLVELERAVEYMSNLIRKVLHY
ncbi:hypothetical protein [Paenibacillus sp. Root444D2]|uniref:hypothetical protein n=1 Tax=Paenibacillus sp. Root444D2 TaxID=1736538 RepID=UPI00070CCB7B|nr:hypothetical protein [Paenibacillus sp. Root444D2]KQX69252.1 hypothetical protein ASD40_01760 [Paenibacillus sp. Root444D2]